MVLIILIILTSPLFAQHNHQCLHNADGIIDCSSADKHLEAGFFDKVLDWWAATENKVKNAKCQNAGKPSEEEMLNYIDRKSAEKVNDSFFGMSFTDEDPHKLQLLKTLTKYDGFWNFFDEEENIKNQKSFNIPEGCDKVLCAAKSIFGEKQAPKLLYLLDKYELNLSHVTDENIIAFKDQQLDTILEGVDDLPSHLIPFERNQYFKHYKNGYGPSSSTIANATITFYDPWDNQESEEKRMYTVVHEIGHNIGSRLKQDEDPEWLSITGWIELDGEWTALNEDKQVSKYGATNPAEDFAKAFSGYRYDPEGLKERSPEKYEYMKKNVFLGLEYTSEEKCKDSNSKLNEIMNELNIAEAPVPERYPNCKQEIAALLNREDVSFKECIEKGMINDVIESKPNLSKFEKDALKQAINFKEDLGSSIPNEVELESTKKIIGDFFGSIAKRYSNYSQDCSNIERYGWQNAMEFNKFNFDNEFENIVEEDEINGFMGSLCNEIGSQKKKITCKDLAPYMQAYIPAKLEIEVNKSNVTKIQGSDPNDFRCVIN